MTISFDVLNRFSGAVQFTAQIECDENAPTSIKLGLAVRWAIKNGVGLIGADLHDADLRGEDLHGTDLGDVYLRGAYLGGTDLRGAYLRDAYLGGAYLVGANLRGAYFGGAYLGGAYFRGHRLARGESLIPLGFPDGWTAFTYLTETGEQRVMVGCRDFTITEGRAYWAGKPHRLEVLAALDYAAAIAGVRKWGAA